MHSLHVHLSEKQRELGRHPLFPRLERDGVNRHTVAFVSTLTFWALAFQDLLRLNEARVEDPYIRRLAREHRAEDSGHDTWFLADLVKLRGGWPDVRVLFGPGHAATRDATYALLSEVFRAESDAERIVLVLALECAGHVFFGAVARAFERSGLGEDLQYFSHSHLEVEESHSIFDEQLSASLSAMELSGDARASACALVDRVHAAFTAMFDGFEAVLQEREALAPPDAIGAEPPPPAA